MGIKIKGGKKLAAYIKRAKAQADNPQHPQLDPYQHPQLDPQPGGVN